MLRRHGRSVRRSALVVFRVRCSWCSVCGARGVPCAVLVVFRVRCGSRPSVWCSVFGWCARCMRGETVRYGCDSGAIPVRLRADFDAIPMRFWRAFVSVGCPDGDQTATSLTRLRSVWKEEDRRLRKTAD